MGWFNWPSDPDYIPPKYYRDNKLTAQRIDAGIALALRSTENEEVHKDTSDNLNQ